jgi:hypothetical protein
MVVEPSARDPVSNSTMLITRLQVDLASAWKGVRGGGVSSLVAVAALALGIGASTTASKQTALSRVNRVSPALI